MKKVKRVLAMFLTMAMVMGMSTMNIFAAGGLNSDDPSVSTADVTVKNLQKETTSVSAYQFLTASYDKTSGEVTYALTDWAATALNDTASVKTNDKVDVDKVITELGGTVGAANGESDDMANDKQDATNAILNILGKAAKNATAAATIKQITPNTAWDATFTGLKVGSYVVLATDNKNLYNPMEISVGLKADDNGKLSDVVADGTVAKFSTIPFDKVITSKDGGEANPGGTDGTNDAKGGDLQVGEKVSYKLTGKIPSYDTNVYTKIVYTINDTLSDGLTAPEAKDITVKVGNVAVSPVEGKAASYVTVNGQTITVDFSSIAKEHINEDVEVTYSATLNQKASTGFDANTNTAKLTYSNGPSEGDTATTEDKKTYTYTFAIDGSVFGNSITNGHELKKTGKDTWTKTDTDPIASAYKALADAQFTLYSDNECKNAIDKSDLKNNANPVSSTADGSITFTGLDAGTKYYLKETKAPAGYSLNSKVYQVEFTPTYNPDGTMASYKVLIDDTEVANYTYSAAAGTTPATVNAIYSSTTKAADGTTTIEATEIRNTKLANLPSTGGMGTYLFTIIGIAVMAFAAFMFFKNRRTDKD